MNGYAPGDHVITADNTAATFVKYLGAPYGGAATQAIIRVGVDTRVVDPITLQSAQ